MKVLNVVTLSCDKDEAVSQHGIVGRDFVYNRSNKDSPNDQAFLYRQRVLYDGKRLFIATHIGSPNATIAKSGKLFMDSLQPLNAQSKSANKDK